MDEEPVISWDDIRGEGPDNPTNADPAKPADTPPADANPANTPTDPPENPDPNAPPAGQEPPETPPDEDAPVSQLPPDKSKKPQYRLRPNDETEALALEMMRSAQKAGAPLSLKDALAKAETITKPGDGSPAAEPADDLKAADDELAEVRQKLDAFAEDESLYTKEVRQAQKRELELVAKKDRIEQAQQRQQAQVAQSEAQQFEDAETKSWEAATGRFEDIANPDSALAKAVRTEWDAIADNPKHPLYSLPDLPETLVAKHAARLGIAPKVATSPVTPPAPATTPQKPPAPGLKTVPASTGRTPPPVPVSEAQKEAQSNAALANAGSEAELSALLGDELFGKAREQRGYAFR